ncbi:serine/threonine protein kinase [Streptomyces sp. UNOC14_S4]|nr:serine/threonine protein kinase [Streptomyces sp. UNOC14_S4]
MPRGYRVGDWEVTEPIGAGGWATVYAGRPVGDGLGNTDAGNDAGNTDGQGAAAGSVGSTDRQDVALKFLPTAGLAPLQARNVAEAARREVELGRRARHPRLIRLLDSVVLAEPGHPYLDGAIVLVMERAERSLRSRLAEEVTEAEGARLFTGICEGLAHLHRSGWVHGDLKPDNVLLMADGSVKLSDFGLAAELTGDHATHGYVPPMGTLDYLPPERWKAPLGEHGVRIRPSADIWALGVMIHEVFASGAPPFPGATPVSRGAAAQEYADGRAPLRMDDSVPPFWRGLAADCLAPTHAARVAHTAESLLARIADRPVVDGQPTEEVTEEAAKEVTADTADDGRTAGRPPARRRSGIRAALVALAVCGVAAAAIWIGSYGSYAGRDGTSDTPAATVSADTAAAEAAGRIRVFNAEQGCRARTDRAPECSLGLAIDPLRPYTIDNVVPTRVWHGDVLAVDCRLPRGMPIIDETDAQSAEWYRVRLPAGSTRPTAWLPAVRTKDRPAVPECPRPTPVR